MNNSLPARADKGAEGAVEVRTALSFTLDVVGQDANSGPFWQEAVQHLLAHRPGSQEFAALFPQAGGVRGRCVKGGAAEVHWMVGWMEVREGLVHTVSRPQFAVLSPQAGGGCGLWVGAVQAGEQWQR